MPPAGTFAVCGLAPLTVQFEAIPESATLWVPAGRPKNVTLPFVRIGWLLHVVVSPVLLVLFFFGAVVPIGLALRLFGKDPLRLRRGAGSYWIERRPPGPEPRTMTEVY